MKQIKLYIAKMNYTSFKDTLEARTVVFNHTYFQHRNYSEPNISLTLGLPDLNGFHVLWNGLSFSSGRRWIYHAWIVHKLELPLHSHCSLHPFNQRINDHTNAVTFKVWCHSLFLLTINCHLTHPCTKCGQKILLLSERFTSLTAFVK